MKKQQQMYSSQSPVYMHLIFKDNREIKNINEKAAEKMEKYIVCSK